MEKLYSLSEDDGPNYALAEDDTEPTGEEFDSGDATEDYKRQEIQSLNSK